MQGILITTNDQEKICVSEAYNLLNEVSSMDGIASEFQDLEERRLCDYVLYVSQDFLGISCQSTEGPLCPGVTNLIGSVGGGGGGGD